MVWMGTRPLRLLDPPYLSIHISYQSIESLGFLVSDPLAPVPLV